MKIKKLDLILVGGVLVVALALWLILRPRVGGEMVRVTVEGQPYALLPLNKDTELLIQGPHGGENLLVIHDGTACVERADCYNQVCVDTGDVSEVGELIVCLPHKVVIEIEGNG